MAESVKYKCPECGGRLTKGCDFDSDRLYMKCNMCDYRTEDHLQVKIFNVMHDARTKEEEERKYIVIEVALYLCKKCDSVMVPSPPDYLACVSCDNYQKISGTGIDLDEVQDSIDDLRSYYHSLPATRRLGKS